MKHEEIRELLALRLYGEIDAEEARALAAHMAGCETCARFEQELEAGLGRARTLSARTREAELPADWDARLAGSTAALRRGRWAREAGLVAAGIAAGVLLMFAWRAQAPGASPRVAERELASDAPAFVRYLGDTPPPLATAGGPAARFGAWGAR